MKFVSMRLLVNDFAASVRFWHGLLRLNMTYSDESMGYAYFETGSTTGIELYQRDSFASALGEVTPTAAPTGRQTVLTFGVDDVDTTYADLVKHGASAVSGPHDRPEWRARTAHISDPDGNLVELYSPLQPSELPTA